MAITEPEMRAKFLATVRSFEFAKQAATALGISQQYLSDLINGKREISAQVAEKLGYRKIVRYQKLSDKERGEGE